MQVTPSLLMTASLSSLLDTYAHCAHTHKLNTKVCALFYRKITFYSSIIVSFLYLLE